LPDSLSRRTASSLNSLLNVLRCCPIAASSWSKDRLLSPSLPYRGKFTVLLHYAAVIAGSSVVYLQHC
jgi:hypothetical protein